MNTQLDLSKLSLENCYESDYFHKSLLFDTFIEYVHLNNIHLDYVTDAEEDGPYMTFNTKEPKYHETKRSFLKIVWMLNYNREEFNEEKIIENYEEEAKERARQEFAKLE